MEGRGRPHELVEVHRKPHLMFVDLTESGSGIGCVIYPEGGCLKLLFGGRMCQLLNHPVERRKRLNGFGCVVLEPKKRIIPRFTNGTKKI